MEIVVKIPDDMIKSLEQGSFGAKYNIYDLAGCLMNGTPLPKGHGDLIDRRELKKEVYTTTEWNGDIHRIIYETSIDDAKPIIEADKGVLEKINEKQNSLRATCKAWDEAISRDGYVD